MHVRQQSHSGRRYQNSLLFAGGLPNIHSPYLNSPPDVHGRRLGEKDIAEAGRLEVVDAEVNSGDSPEPGCHVRADAGQRLRYERGNPAVQHLERLAAFGGDLQPPGDFLRGEVADLEADGVEWCIQ
ncbi:unnamed protein product [Cuscuta epithymum]|uniref:Uncharacterized protein n=1 Tax=Cuscuta epithymum TaxID=186058 RepID=A0AAV0G1P2_9ASTE|nr:unnamed protein product [Cuscuta epithymum]